MLTKNLVNERNERQGAPQERPSPTPTQAPQHFKRRIGTTVFRVAVHFNPESKETAESKIARLIRSEAATAKAAIT